MNTMTGRSFKKLREKAGLSRQDAATALGITANGVYFWESSRSFPRPELWDDLITLYKFDRSELITLAGGKDSSRVRRYLAKRQEQPERRGRRIYVRSQPGDIGQREPRIDKPRHQNPEPSDFLHRINDLERRVAKLQDSMEIVDRIEALLDAWKRLINGLKPS